jgi:hypothetical protein
LKNNKSVEEMLDYGPIKEKTVIIAESLAKEKSLDTAGDTVTVTGLAASTAGATSGTTGNDAAAASSAASSSAGVANTDTWRAKAARLVKSDVKLVVEPNTEATVCSLLKTSETVCAWRGNPGVDYVGVLFEPSIANESVTAPHIRTPPFQKNQYQRLVGGCLKARACESDDGTAADAQQISSGDMFISLDGGKHGHHS